MKVIVDTSAFSVALRHQRSQNSAVCDTIEDLVNDGLLMLMGPVRQELLSGIRDIQTFEKLKSYLAAFEDLPMTRADYEEAARSSNTCRAKGIQASHTDFLICAAAFRREMAIYTLDKDFQRLQKHLPIILL